MSKDSIPADKAKELYKLFMEYLTSGGRPEILHRMVLVEAAAESGKPSADVFNEASSKAKIQLLKSLDEWKKLHNTEKSKDGGGGLYWHHDGSLKILELVIGKLNEIKISDATYEKTITDELLGRLDLVKQAWSGTLAGADRTSPDAAFKKTHKQFIAELEEAAGGVVLPASAKK